MFSVARNSGLRTVRTRLRQSQPIAVPQYSAFARLASTLAVLEQKDGKIVSQSLAAITAGTKLGGSITAFVAGSGVKSAAEEAAKSKGVEKVIYVDNAAYDRVSKFRINTQAISTDKCSVYQRTMRHSWSRISRRVDIHT